MKKSLLALSAAAIALSGMAVNPLQVQKASPINPDRSIPLKSSLANFNPEAAKPSMMKAPAKAPSSADVITEVEGTSQNMTFTGSGYYNFWGYLFTFEKQDIASHVVYGENDEVYFYDILPNAPTESYVKGVKNGDKIEISLPQTTIYFDDYDYGMYLCMLTYVEEEDETWTYSVLDDVNSLTLSVSEDGSMVVEGLDDANILGFAYTDDNTWTGYGVTELSMTPFYGTPVTAPDDIEVSKAFWLFDDGDYAIPVNWAQGYDEVYFQGLGTDMPDAWMRGTVEYGDDAATISIAQNQYLGVLSGVYVYTKCATLEFDEDGYVIDGELMPSDYQYELIWNYEDNTIVAKDPNVYLILNGTKDDRIYYIQFMNDIALMHQDDFSGTPADPNNLVFEDYYESYKYGAFIFNVPAVSTEGDFLDTDDLYYVVYVDGEEWTFDAEEYQIPETLEEIPWNFGAYYIYNYGATTREADFFVEGITTLGVQSVYKYNGEETRSEIVSINLDDPEAVAPIDADKKIAKVTYFDMAGRQVANPAAGIFVKRVVFEDGTVATFKKAVR